MNANMTVTLTESQRADFEDMCRLISLPDPVSYERDACQREIVDLRSYLSSIPRIETTKIALRIAERRLMRTLDSITPEAGVWAWMRKELSSGCLLLFLAYAYDAANWSGNPPIGCNVEHGRRENGYLTHLKKAGLLSTWTDEGLAWIRFSERGKAAITEIGFSLD